MCKKFAYGNGRHRSRYKNVDNSTLEGAMQLKQAPFDFCFRLLSGGVLKVNKKKSSTIYGFSELFWPPNQNMDYSPSFSLKNVYQPPLPSPLSLPSPPSPPPLPPPSNSYTTSRTRCLWVWSTLLAPSASKTSWRERAEPTSHTSPLRRGQRSS